jgi:hypothetical protein
MPAAFAVGPGYPLRFSKGGLGFVASSLWVGEKNPVICCGESGDQFCFLLVIQAWPINDHRLWIRGFFSPDSFRSSSCILEEGWNGYGCISLVFCGVENAF